MKLWLIESDIMRAPIRVRHSATDLSSDDQSFLQHALRLWACVFADYDLVGDAEYLLQALTTQTIDIVKLDNTLKWVREEAINALNHDIENIDVPYDCGMRKFKAFARENQFYWFALKPYMDLLCKITAGDVSAFVKTRATSCFLKKINLRSVDYTEEVYDRWRATEARIGELQFSAELIADLQRPILEWCRGYSTDWTKCRHSDGATAECRRGTPASGKFNTMCKYSTLGYVCAQYGIEPYWDWEEVGGIRTAVQAVVPKAVQKNRGIAYEPTSLQFFQHAVAESLDSTVFHNGPLAKFIDLHSTDRSQRLARTGSITGEYATIDLSDASDSISLTLIRAITTGTTLLRDIVLTRSSHIKLLDGEVVRLNKFASMGSSLCFPIECIVFAACCAAAVYRTAHRSPRDEDFFVYGDDIVIRSHFVPHLLKILEEAGFVVNAEKSFWSPLPHNFREACGGEYLDGWDVKTLSLSRKLTKPPTTQKEAHRDPASLLRWCKLQNELTREGMLVARTYVTCVVLRPYLDQLQWIGLYDPYSLEEDEIAAPFLLSLTEGSNWRLRSRSYDNELTHPWYSKTQFKRLTVTTSTDYDSNNEAGAYAQWWNECIRATRESDEPILRDGAIRRGPSHLVLRKTWR